jgi:hypothetical protein
MLRWDDIDLPLRVRRGMPHRRRVDSARCGFSRLSGVFRAWPRVKTRQQNGQNAGQDYAVKVPAPPIEAAGAPRPRTLSRVVRSAPINVPRLPAIRQVRRAIV